jgi:hypothetical protein
MIRDDVHLLGEIVGLGAERPRNAVLSSVATTIEKRLCEAGLAVKTRPPSIGAPGNIEAVIIGVEKPAEAVVIAADYGIVCTPAAFERAASGIAGLLALAHALQEPPLSRTVRFVALVNRDHSASCGAEAYADDLLRAGPRVAAMMSIESIGVVHSEDAASRKPPVKKRISDALCLVGDVRSASTMRKAKQSAEQANHGLVVRVPVLSCLVPRGAHVAPTRAAFVRRHIPAFSVTDAAPRLFPRFRRAAGPGPASLDFERLGRASFAIAAMVRELAGPHPRTSQTPTA